MHSKTSRMYAPMPVPLGSITAVPNVAQDVGRPTRAEMSGRMSGTCDLWRSAAPSDSPGRSRDSVPLEALFPSARRAIAQTLADAGHTTTSRIGHPRFVSACVPRAIQNVATPVSARGMSIDDYTRLDGLLVHEQWGWPLSSGALARLLTRCAQRLLVIDRVDSADFFSRSIDHPDVVEVLSLSKTLGLLGGGLARKSSRYSVFESRAITPRTRHAFDGVAAGRPGEAYREFFKNSDQAIHPAVSAWVLSNSIVASVEYERVRRQYSVGLLQGSPLADGWPRWMHAAVASGAGPDLAPVLRGRGPLVWTDAMRVLGQEFGVASTIGAFNWTGDPLEPEYEHCMLIPVHGDVQHLGEVLRALAAC